MPPTTEVPLPLLSIIELPFGNISECFLGALFYPVSIRLAEVRESPALTGNALEFPLVTPFLTRLVGVLSVLLPEPICVFPIIPTYLAADVTLPLPVLAVIPA